MKVDPQAGDAIVSLVQQAEQLKAATRSGAADSAAKPEDLLFSALGAQLQLHEENPTRAAVFSSSITAGFNDTLRDLGKRYFKLVEKALHDLLCGSDGEDVDGAHWSSLSRLTRCQVRAGVLRGPARWRRARRRSRNWR